MKNFTVVAFILALILFLGCKTEIGGGHDPNDPDVHYFPKGPEYKLQIDAHELSNPRTTEDE